MSNTITTPAVRVSYPTLFTPRAAKAGQDPKFGIVLMFDKENPAHMDCIKKLHGLSKAVQDAKWPDASKAPRIPITGHDRSPIKDGDTACNNQGVPISEKNPEYAGHWIVRASTEQRPVVVDRDKSEIMDTNKVYGGCQCKVNINPYAYDKSGNKGVTFGLNGVQFWADGDSFGGGRPTVDDMFSADTGADNPDNYQDKQNADPFG